MSHIDQVLSRIHEKKQKLDSSPMPVILKNNLDEWFSIEFTYTSNAIEGNTLSMSETAMVVEKGITIGGKTIREHLEAINHAQAIDFIRELARKKQTDLALDDILAIHKIVLQKIDDIHAGQLREVGVRVVGSATVFPNPAKVPFLMVDFISWLQTASSPIDSLKTGSPMEQSKIGDRDHPVIVAALAHYKLVTIHPFVDGNGRTARLLMNLLLLQHGYPLAIIKKEKRVEYIAAIEHARQKDDMTEFYKVIMDAVEYTLDSYLETIEQSIVS